VGMGKNVVPNRVQPIQDVVSTPAERHGLSGTIARAVNAKE